MNQNQQQYPYNPQQGHPYPPPPPHQQHPPPPPQYGFQGPPPPQYPIHMQPQPGTVFVTHQPLQVNVGPNPCHTQCPSCRADIVTKMDYEATSKTHCAALILCCFICWPCAWLPYVMDSCKAANHYCPNCDAYIGTYKN